MTAIPIGIALYTVTSEKNSNELYQVDLLAYECAGHCSCPDFGVRHERLVAKEGAYSPCKHILCAREAFCNHMLHSVAKHQKEKKTHAHR